MATMSTYDPYFDTGDTGTMAYTDVGSDIATVFPRHVGARVMTTAEGDVIWRPAADIFETEKEIVVHCDLPWVLDLFNFI